LKAAPAVSGRPAAYVGVFVAALVVVAGGVLYRVSAAHFGVTSDAFRLPQRLSTLPVEFAGWRGTDIPLSGGTLRIAGNDDYVCRSYVEESTGTDVTLYVAYTGQPRTMLRHRPAVCYPSAGWSLLSTEDRQLAAPGVAGGTLPVRVHRFLKVSAAGETVTFVLNYYVLNGLLTTDEYSFWGLRHRDPGVARDASRYVAQVQIIASTAGSEEATRAAVERFAAAAAGEVLGFLPGVESTSGARSAP
jgi:EpsI family protein